MIENGKFSVKKTFGMFQYHLNAYRDYLFYIVKSLNLFSYKNPIEKKHPVAPEFASYSILLIIFFFLNLGSTFTPPTIPSCTSILIEIFS